MTIVYFPADVHVMCSRDQSEIKTHPSVCWGVVRDDDPFGDESVYVERFALNPYTLIDGVPLYEFHDDTEWKKLPKKWTHNTDLLSDRLSVDPKRKEMLDDISGMYVENPAFLIRCIECGYLIPADQASAQVEAEIEKGRYRIIRKKAVWTLTYGSPSRNRLMPRSDVFLNYSDALIKAKLICADYLDRIAATLEIDRADDIRWVLSKLPEDKRLGCRFIMENLPLRPYGVFRVFDGSVFFCAQKNGEWEEIFRFA